MMSVVEFSRTVSEHIAAGCRYGQAVFNALPAELTEMIVSGDIPDPYEMQGPDARVWILDHIVWDGDTLVGLE